VNAPLLRTDLVTVFRLRAFVSRECAEPVLRELRELPGVRHVLVTDDPGHETALVSADVDPAAADRVLEALPGIGVSTEDLSLSRDEKITLGGVTPAAGAELAWSAVLRPLGGGAAALDRFE
jgi:hypothetical protein